MQGARLKLLALVLVAAVAGAGLATGPAYAEADRHPAPVGSVSAAVVSQPCLTLAQLNALRQEIARRLLQSPEPVAAYRAAVDEVRQRAAEQPYECLVGLRTALIREQGARFVRLMFDLGSGVGCCDMSADPSGTQAVATDVNGNTAAGCCLSTQDLIAIGIGGWGAAMVLGGLAVLQGVSAVNPAPQVVGQLVSGLGMIGYGLMDLVHAIEMIANGGSNGGSNGGGGGEDGNGHGGNS